MSLLQMSFAGAVMILAIIVIRALAINLLPKKTFLVLWGIAVARLLLPFCIPSAFSLYSLIGNPAPVVNSVKWPQTAVTLPSDIYGQTVIPDNISNTVNPVSVWTVIWGAGVLVCALVFAVAYWKCRQEFQTSLPVDNGFIQSWLNEHRLKRPISIRQSNRFSAPLTYGIFRPVILMPTSIDWENTKSLQYVLTHEYVHIRRFDSITKLVLIVILCVHWFNPLVWAMYILANRDIELSCDEAVIRHFGENTKAAYARSLISMEETRSGLTPLCNNFNKNAIEERITAIMKYKKTSIFSLVLALALIFGTTTAFATSAQQESDYFVTDENGNPTVFDGHLTVAPRFSLDESGKYVYNPDSKLNGLSAEYSIPPTELDNLDNADFNITPEGTMNQSQQEEDFYYQPTGPRYTEAEMEQIIADIESGKIPGYKMSDFLEGKVPSFEKVDGTEWSVDFVDYPNSSCVMDN
ncbi:MAG: M56 family metallopeptidase [Firmicutes bacterium]|nr:M56 family metallopeptidase [Bacillota bacterium]